jgi:hypothetical protein
LGELKAIDCLLSNGSGLTDGSAVVGSAFTLSNGSGGDATIWAHDLDILGLWETGIALSGVTGGVISRSRLTGMSVGAALASTTNVQITRNVIADTVDEAVTLDGGSTGNLLWNTLESIGASPPYSGSDTANRFLFDIATTSRLGMVSIGDGLSITADGVLSSNGSSGGGGIFSGAKVRLTSNESIGNITGTQIPWDSEVYDDGAYWSGANPTRLTVPTTGKYHFEFFARWAANGTGQRFITFIINGDTADRVSGDNRPGVSVDSAETYHGISADISLSAGDYVEARVFQSSGGALNLLSTVPYTSFSVFRID